READGLGGSWSHRAFWGDDLIDVGDAGTPSRRRAGDIPTQGGWARLSIPATDLGFRRAGSRVTGVSFAVAGGPLAWGRVGIWQPDGTSTRESREVVWLDDDTPPGTRLSGTWAWIDRTEGPVQVGARAHVQTAMDGKPVQHYAVGGMSTPVGPADTLWVWVRI